GKDSVHPAYPFQLSTRDLARIGLLFLNRGRWRDQQIIPAKWITQSTRAHSDVGDSGGYGYMWWVATGGRHLPGVQIPDGSFSARGYRGHHLLVIPDWHIVIAHRVNTFQKGRSVSRTQFGKLTAMILAARPSLKQRPAAPPLPRERAAVHQANHPRNTTAAIPYDVLLTGGRIIDGTGDPGRIADIGIRGGRIADIGKLAGRPAHCSLDVSDHVVAPGFIDMHSHADRGLIDPDPLRRSAPNLIAQGITTVVVNQDGSGASSIREQRQAMHRLGIGLNAIQMIGHGTIRRLVMGDDFRRPATPEEIARMQHQLRIAMQQGARGLSAGLEYVPGRWSTPREMESLVTELAPHKGVYIVHERSSGRRPMWYLPSRDDPQQPSMIDNLQELIRIADATRVPVVATHIKARGVDFWGSSKRMIAMVDHARSEGIPLYADQYPYNTSGSDGRIVLIPKWVGQSSPRKEIANATPTATKPPSPAALLELVLANTSRADDVRRDIAHEILRRGGSQQLFVMEHPHTAFIGQSLSKLAQQQKCDAVEMAIRLQLRGDRNRRGGARLRAYSMSQSDVDAFASTKWTATSSDAGIALPEDGPVHPRYYGAFPRKIHRYAIKHKLISLEEAVRVCTSLPARILGIQERGRIVKGHHADLVVFDPQSIRDTADAFHPHRFPVGIPYVLVGGKLMVDQGRVTGNLAGHIIR
ncbi:MAG: amidohydrolase family protein, partial [Planctomycetaceae bacterium]